ncbi:unnamed protein product [Blepharisma stoltei]|uniref:Peptidase S49 domain-containing protein n=1 Tax=Blepharisma stoltei TaxID=1481888 RepID=A0AAU9K283_9CILI|nr:unnamed protein product [Blepharisma stoltei]
MIARFAKSLKSIVAHTHISGAVNQKTALKLEEDLHKLRWSSPKMIAVSINTAHGSFGQAQQIVHMLKAASDKFDCPIYTFAQDIAAGPGYYILASGNKVFADPHSIIGNISVNYNTLGLTEFSKQFQVTLQNVAHGKHKLRLNSFEKVKSEDEAWLKGILGEWLNIFKKHVLESRGNRIPRDAELEKKIFSGDSFIAKKAIELGLVDSLGEVYSVVEKEFAGVKVREFPAKDYKAGPNYEVLLMKLRDGTITESEMYEAVDELSVNFLSNRMQVMTPY